MRILVCLDVRQGEAATFVRRLLRHKEFNTQAKRMGKVIRVATGGLTVWEVRGEKERNFAWERE
jgi:hypothetical protein